MLSPGVAMILLCLMSVTVALTTAPECSTSEDILPCICARVKKSQNVYETHVQCSGLGLEDIPDNLPRDTRSLDLTNNRILPENLKNLSQYRFLKHLSLANNNISHLIPRTFESTFISKSLNMEGNILDYVSNETLLGLARIETLIGIEAVEFEPTAFSSLTDLKELAIVLHQEKIPETLVSLMTLRKLNMDFRKATELPENLLRFQPKTLMELSIVSKTLQQIHPDLLLGMSVLKVFRLDVFDMHTLPSNIFHRVEKESAMPVNLDEITISGVRSLPRNIFQGQESVGSIELHEVEDMPANLFQGLVTLDSLDMSRCYIGYGQVTQHWFSDLTSLKSLDLSQCSLSFVGANDFVGLTSLVTLDLSLNSIRSINQSVFHDFRYSLKCLILKGNIISQMDVSVFKDMSYLQHLDLSDNKISELDQNAFETLIHLIRLDLHDNRLVSLSKELLSNQRNLMHFNASSNAITAVPNGFFDSTTALTHVDFQNNLLTSFPLVSLWNMPDIQSIELENNPIHCGCEFITQKLAISTVVVSGECFTPAESHGLEIMALSNNDACAQGQTTSPHILPSTHSSESSLAWRMPNNVSVTPALKHVPGKISTMGPNARDWSVLDKNITADLSEAKGSDEQDDPKVSDGTYVALGGFLGVAFICIPIVACLYVNKRRKGDQVDMPARSVNNFDPPIIKISMHDADFVEGETQPEAIILLEDIEHKPSD